MNSPGQVIRAAVEGLRASASARRSIAVRAGLCVALPLVIGAAIGHPAQGAAASFGGLAGVYVPQSPYRYRARVVASVGIALALNILIGSLVGGHGWLAAPVTGLIAGVASFVCQAADLPPPRELMLVMAALAATDIPSAGRQSLERAGLAAAGAALAWLVTMSPAVFGRRRAPEQRAVAGALAAVAGLLDALGSPDVGASRRAAVTAVRFARGVVVQGGAADGHRLTRAVVEIEALLEATLHLAVETNRPLDPAWSAAVRALVPAVASRIAEDPPVPNDPDIIGAVALRDALADVRATLTGTADRAAERPVLPGSPGVLALLGAAARRHSVILPAATRIGIAVAAGVGIGRALGLGHSYWVGLTAAAVLQGSNLAVTRRRVVHRVVGTLIGVGLAYAVLGWHPPLWLVVASAAVFQALVELVIAFHYAVAVVGITVLSLVLFHLAAPNEAVAGAIGARLIDTAIGAALALLLRATLWPRATSVRLPQVQARALRAVRAVLAVAWSGDRDENLLTARRHALQGELAVLRTVQADALADTLRESGPSAARWPISVAIEELAFLALSRPTHNAPPSRQDAELFLRRLEELNAAVTGGPPAVAAALPGYPHTAAAAAALAAAVADAGRR